MNKRQVLQMRSLEGQLVCLALQDGSRIDDCQLVSCGRQVQSRVWVYSNGFDRFVELGDVIDLWESEPARAGATVR
jgi:hypothetical protein